MAPYRARGAVRHARTCSRCRSELVFAAGARATTCVTCGAEYDLDRVRLPPPPPRADRLAIAATLVAVVIALVLALLAR